jgi:hypothetical protein
MRYLHLTFLLMFLLAGATLGEYVLRSHLLRWLLVFVPLAAVNGYAQRTRYPSTRNLELPWEAPRGDWLQAFEWVKTNTPQNAVFALDPYYLALPGEDNHSFRALAERSSLADDQKDAAVVTQVPALADTWVAQHREQAGWPTWTRADRLPPRPDHPRPLGPRLHPPGPRRRPPLPLPQQHSQRLPHPLKS